MKLLESLSTSTPATLAGEEPGVKTTIRDDGVIQIHIVIDKL